MSEQNGELPSTVTGLFVLKTVRPTTIRPKCEFITGGFSRTIPSKHIAFFSYPPFMLLKNLLSLRLHSTKSDFKLGVSFNYFTSGSTYGDWIGKKTFRQQVKYLGYEHSEV